MGKNTKETTTTVIYKINKSSIKVVKNQNLKKNS